MSANKRMFSNEVVGSDAFFEMPPSTQALYFQLGMRADDDGFVNPKMVMRLVGSTDDELKVLIAKRFVLPFENGVIVIKHWGINNNKIQKDRYKQTMYLEQKNLLFIKENGAYTMDKNKGIPACEQSVNKKLTKSRVEESRVEESRVREDKTPTPSQIAKEFFDGKVDEMLDIFKKSSSLSEDLLRNEFRKFILYWTEPNKSGTKQRWQQQTTFELKRRLATWLGNMKDYKNNRNTPNFIL